MKRFLTCIGLLAALCVLLCGCETVVPADGTTTSSESTTTVSTTLSTTTTESTSATIADVVKPSATTSHTTVTTTSKTTQTTARSSSSTVTETTTTTARPTTASTHSATRTTTTATTSPSKSSVTQMTSLITSLIPDAVIPDVGQQRLTLRWNTETVTVSFEKISEQWQDGYETWYYVGKTSAGKTLGVKVAGRQNLIVSIAESVDWEKGNVLKEDVEPFLKQRLSGMEIDASRFTFSSRVLASKAQAHTSFAIVEFGEENEFSGQVCYVDGGPRLTQLSIRSYYTGQSFPAFFTPNWA